jgi:predicted NAD/FAD-dependent oxidoreductase
MQSGNNTLGALLANGINVQFEKEISSVVSSGNKWIVDNNEFNYVVLSIPWPQAAKLINSQPSAVTYNCNLTGVFEYNCKWNGENDERLPYAYLFENNNDLAWIAVENAKCNRVKNDKLVLVAQCSDSFSKDNAENDVCSWLADIQNKVELTMASIPLGMSLVSSQRGISFGHRWRYARNAGTKQGIHVPKGMFVCGDSRSASKLEDVWMSGAATADDIITIMNT